VDDDDTTPASSWTRRRSTVTLLALVVGISPFATDMYVPALPAIARDLDTTTAVAQLSLTAFLVSFALGQFVIGPLSDGIGRRRVLLIGTAIFTVASLGCALAPARRS
jgi:DHA1 family bicyclomycin/chloramphenicol resistance-like MFS transporter